MSRDRVETKEKWKEEEKGISVTLLLVTQCDLYLIIDMNVYLFVHVYLAIITLYFRVKVNPLYLQISCQMVATVFDL